MPDDDCWDAFGSDNEDEDQEAEDTPLEKAQAVIALHLSQAFLKDNPQIALSERMVGLAYSVRIDLRGMHVIDGSSLVPTLLDAFVVMESSKKQIDWGLASLLPGGMLIARSDMHVNDGHFYQQSVIYEAADVCFVVCVKRPILVHYQACPWLPSSRSIAVEENHLFSATITPSSYEVSRGQLSDSSIKKAARCLHEYGYCVVRKLLDPATCKAWGSTVLESVHSAAQVLLDRDHVDIYHPHTSKFEPQVYREMSMREDLRMDLRFGPQLGRLRSKEDMGNEPIVISAETTEYDGFLRGNASLLAIIRRTMNQQQGELFKGNLGRYNFGGSGADGSFQDLRMSPVGGIVSLPGCADQALHADTPHLFEHTPDLPAHYINLFAPGTAFHQEVGGTAFIHGSHNLEYTAKHCGSADNYDAVYPNLVRPCSTLGDVILFDCRILHFGLANKSDSIERTVLYANATLAWFHDPKNWDDHRSVYESNSNERL